MVLAGIAELEDGLNIKHDPTECSKNRVHMMDAAFLVQTRPTSDHTRRRHAVQYMLRHVWRKAVGVSAGRNKGQSAPSTTSTPTPVWCNTVFVQTRSTLTLSASLFIRDVRVQHVFTSPDD